ncbi:hypothetical protein H4582DRAFT_2063123 [Lactarius indigo]|nr:hypothetical protein H4582DRAFT_2063123 [Lactarius indigo]
MRKPSAANAAAGTAGSAGRESQLVRSHGGDSAHEGGIGIRGVVLAWHGRSGGVAIMGAAEKRTREEGKVDTEDSAAKRLLLTVTRTPVTQLVERITLLYNHVYPSCFVILVLFGLIRLSHSFALSIFVVSHLIHRRTCASCHRLKLVRAVLAPIRTVVGILSRDKTSSFQSGVTRNAPNQLQKVGKK